MARKPRVEFEGAFYHVLARGNQRQNVFRDDQDRRFYIERVEHYRKRYGFTLYAFVLMANHVHLLIETGAIPLSRIMQGIQFSYTQRYNWRHRTVGHLFQSRYKPILCDRDEYLLELVRYIHLNPARMHRTQNPWTYPWSSHGAYLGQRSPVGVETSLVLQQFGRSLGLARRRYIKFVEEGLGLGHVESFYSIVDQRFLGDEKFIQWVEKRTEGKQIEVMGPKVSFDRLLKVVAEDQRVDPSVLVRSGRHRNLIRARSMLVYLAREWCGLKATKLGKELHRDTSMVTRLHRAYAGSPDRRAESRISQRLKELL